MSYASTNLTLVVAGKQVRLHWNPRGLPFTDGERSGCWEVVVDEIGAYPVEPWHPRDSDVVSLAHAALDTVRVQRVLAWHKLARAQGFPRRGSRRVAAY